MIINSITLKNFRSYEDETTFSFTPNDNKNIIAHTASGMFLKAEAINLLNVLKKLFTLVAFDPIIPKNKANTDAIVVAAIDNNIVSISLSKISGIFNKDDVSGIKFLNIHTTAIGTELIPLTILKFVILEHKTNRAATTRNTNTKASMMQSQMFCIFLGSALETNVRRICSSFRNVIDIPINTTQDRQTRVASYCHATGVLNKNRLITE